MPLSRASTRGRYSRIVGITHDAQPSMMHVRFNDTWHGKVHKQSYKLSGAQYATELHIKENTT